MNPLKRKGDEEWSGNIATNYQERIKLFQKETNKVRNKREGVIISVIKTLDENVAQDDIKVEEGWRKYFREILIVGQKRRKNNLGKKAILERRLGGKI